MAQLLALHLGLVTGWAQGDLAQPPRHGSWRLGESAGANKGEAAAALLDALSDHSKVYGKPSAIVLSAPLTESAREMDAAKAAVLCIILDGIVELFGYRRDIPVTVLEYAKVKESMLAGRTLGAWCLSNGFEPKNAAASHALLFYAHAKQVGVKQRA